MFDSCPIATVVRRVAACLCVAVLTSCGNGTQPSSDVVTVDPAALYGQLAAAALQSGFDATSEFRWSSFVTSFGSLLTQKRYLLQMRTVAYTSTGADGTRKNLSGLLILPSAEGSRPAVPILLYQHVTEVERILAPSRYLDRLDRPTEYPEVMLAAAIASAGYAVAMPDYEGLGDNTGTHPFLHGVSLARHAIDMLRASREIIGTTTGTVLSPCSWNGQLFLMGYSEGGYATMVATHELQLNHGGEFTVTAAAPSAGPHDLSGVMRSVMLSDAPYKAPYFLPYLLLGYDYAYPATGLFSPGFALNSPHNATVPLLLNGTTPAEQINIALGMSYNPLSLIAPRTVLSMQFIDQLSREQSQVVARLRENDSYRGWVPAVPVRMFHHVGDDLVPFGNSQAAFNAFSTAGAKRWVSLVPETVEVDISTNPVNSVHFSAALPVLSDAWQWLDRFRR